MTRVLLTGGSGFIAAHVLQILLEGGHSVVTTVRSEEKAQHIKKAYPSYGEDKLSFAIVEDIAQEGAFDKAVISDPPFEAVIHTASPFHFNVTDTKRDLLDPAVNGTRGVLKAIKASAPSVKRVVITSSFAAIVDPKGKPKGYVYSEKDWNTVTAEEAEKDPRTGYRASKTFAERAGWDFVAKEKPNFDFATINPPLVFGPVENHVASLSNVNTSNELIRDLIHGKFKDKIPPFTLPFWVDVRDVALAHVRAMERPEAGGKRFFVTAGVWSPELVVQAIEKGAPEFSDQLPKDTAGGRLPEDRPDSDNSQAREVLGIKFRSLEESVIDTVKSLKNIPK